MAQHVAQATRVFQQHRTGHAPKAVTLVLVEATLVITLHGALSPAEEALAKSPAGAAEVQDFHRQLFANSCEPLRQEIQRITGVEVRKSVADIEPNTGTVVQVFTAHHGAGIFVAHGLPAGAWNGMDQVIRYEKGGFAVLILSRKNRESVVTGGSVGFERMLKSRLSRFAARK